LTDCNEVIRLKPTQRDGLHIRALIEIMLARYDPAIADFNAALKLYAADDKGRAYPLYGRGFAELKKGSKSAGSSDIAAAKKIDGDVATWYGIWGVK
jgi:hypothetical protein